MKKRRHALRLGSLVAAANLFALPMLPTAHVHKAGAGAPVVHRHVVSDVPGESAPELRSQEDHVSAQFLDSVFRAADTRVPVAPEAIVESHDLSLSVRPAGSAVAGLRAPAHNPPLLEISAPRPPPALL